MPNVEAVNARLGRVLVVEDDPGIATQLVRGLTRAGYETGSVTTGKAALDWPVPDVVLLDLGLPDIDGEGTDPVSYTHLTLPTILRV